MNFWGFLRFGVFIFFQILVFVSKKLYEIFAASGGSVILTALIAV